VPPRVAALEIDGYRIERDAMAILAAVRELDARMQDRLAGIDAKVADVLRAVNTILDRNLPEVFAIISEVRDFQQGDPSGNEARDQDE
jgi:hypothetical protein